MLSSMACSLAHFTQVLKERETAELEFEALQAPSRTRCPLLLGAVRLRSHAA